MDLNMTGNQTFAAIIVAIVTWGAVSISKRIFDYFDKKNEKTIQSKKDKLYIDALIENINKIASI